MWRIALLVIYVVCTSCGVAPQPEAAKTVAAFEIPLASEQERNEFLIILRREAAASGLHVDMADKQELANTANANPEAAMTIHAGVWRGANDDESMATVMDQGHLHQVWIMFSRGENADLASSFRERVMKKLVQRWPDTLSLPSMSTGAIPLHSDLLRTPGGYVVNPSVASKYGLDAKSSSMVQN